MPIGLASLMANIRQEFDIGLLDLVDCSDVDTVLEEIEPAKCYGIGLVSCQRPVVQYIVRDAYAKNGKRGLLWVDIF